MAEARKKKRTPHYNLQKELALLWEVEARVRDKELKIKREMVTKTKLVAKRSSEYLEVVLHKRLFSGGSAPKSVSAELTNFLKSCKLVYKWEVGVTLRKLCLRKGFRPSFKLLKTMAKRGMNLTVSDHAIHLDLVAKARGLTLAEEYFINLPEPAKHHLAYGALLNCYCKELMTEKAEAVMEKMKELRFASNPIEYNSLMTHYTKIGIHYKIPSIIREMKVDDVMLDCFTYNVWSRALAALKDISSVERVIEEMKRDGRVTTDWATYSNLASIYVNAGMFQKAERALKELEKRNVGKDLSAFEFIIALYGRTGNLVEVYCIWQSLKLAHPRMANISYLNMVQVLLNLKDFFGDEICFKEWESK